MARNTSRSESEQNQDKQEQSEAAAVQTHVPVFAPAVALPTHLQEQQLPEQEDDVEPAYAINRIDGTIEPGAMFLPRTKAGREELVRLGAIRDLNEGERALYDQTNANPLG